RGRVPPLVVTAGGVVALRYRWGGGVAGETDTGTILVSAAQFAGFAGVTNFVAARGGRDAETLDMAKLRARKELSTRSRAVTAGDFEWIALQTPKRRVRRAIVVPRHRPLPVLATAWQRQLCAPAKTPGTTTMSAAGAVCGPPGTATTTITRVSAAAPVGWAAPRFSATGLSDCGPPL